MHFLLQYDWSWNQEYKHVYSPFLIEKKGGAISVEKNENHLYHRTGL